MGKQLYPDMDYQEKIYNQLVAQYQGREFTKAENYNLPTDSQRCICPKCGEHSANFFRVRDNRTFLMSCMRGCGLKKTLHQLVLEYGNKKLIEEWKGRLHRLNFENYGTAIPIKNAGRPKGSKTNKHRIKPIKGLTDELGRLRIRGTL